MAGVLETLTANEAACVTQVPLKQVHRIVDAGLLRGGAGVRAGARVISGRALTGLRLAHLTADTLTLDARRRIVGRVLNEPETASVHEDAVAVAVAPVAAAVRAGLETLARARAAVCVDPAIMGGAACFAGTRLPVHDIADMVANGDSVEAVTAAYPQLTADQVRLAGVFAMAYPRRGRPPAMPAWRKTAPIHAKRIRVADLPRA